MSAYEVVVGVDGSDSARQALAWAVGEAHRRGGTVKAVSAWRWDFPEVVFGDSFIKARQRAEAILAHEVETIPAHARHDIPIAAEVIEGLAAEVLVTPSHGADLLVLGSHGHSRALQRVLGSVAEECIRNATCAVVVLPVQYRSRQEANRAAVQKAP